MRYLKPFNESTESPVDFERIRRELVSITKNPHIVQSCTIREDGTVDVIGDFKAVVDIQKLPVKFGIVTGHFDIRSLNLKTLEGCPESCQSFNCSFNWLSSLDGSPKTCQNFNCSNNPIKSLVGGPERVHQKYDCSNTKITNLIGSPETVGDMNVGVTPLTSLEGAPRRIDKDFNVRWTNLKDLVGGPEYVGNWMHIEDSLLTSLEGAPKRVGGIEFSTRFNTLKDPRGLKDTQVSIIIMWECNDPFYKLFNLFTEEDNKRETTRRFIDSLVYNYLRGPIGNPHINLYRLKEALAEFDIALPRMWWITDKIKTLPGYDFHDEEGRVVDFDGNPL